MKQIIVGVDVSKKTLDIFLKPLDQGFTISNDRTGFKLLIKKLRTCEPPLQDVLVLMEHTGKYSLQFELFLAKQGIGFCKLPALEFKKSLGMVRGKDDQVDARRIAEYGWLRRGSLRADQVPSATISQLRESIQLRAKMVRDRAGYMARLKEELATGNLRKTDIAVKIQQDLIKVFTRKIKEVEAHLIALIQQDPLLLNNYHLLLSIKGIGKVIAAYMIAYTDNFTKFKNARKFNCYAGLAPFNNSSGTSKKGRPRVSNLACRQAKTLFDRAACTALQYDQEIKTYYHRKLAEGKAKRSCINAIKAKMVARIFAVVHRQTPFVELPIAA